MSHEWHAGAFDVFQESSWHASELKRAMQTAEEMIKAGVETGAWPVELMLADLWCGEVNEGPFRANHNGARQFFKNLYVPGRAVVGRYGDGLRIAYGAVGSGYTPLDRSEWDATIRAAVAAGAKPAGAFALRGGSRILATFEIPGGKGAIRNYLIIVDDCTGAMNFSVGGTKIRVVCANTLGAAIDADGKGMAKLKHTRSINDRTEEIREAIEEHVKSGHAVSEMYEQARQRKINKREMEKLLDVLYPVATADERKAHPKKATRMDNARTRMYQAMDLKINNEGFTVATVWNGATYEVDRDPETQTLRPCRGGADPLDSMLFGDRGDRIAEVQKVIQEYMADGSIRESVQVVKTAPSLAEMLAA